MVSLTPLPPLWCDHYNLYIFSDYVTKYVFFVINERKENGFELHFTLLSGACKIQITAAPAIVKMGKICLKQKSIAR